MVRKIFLYFFTLLTALVLILVLIAELKPSRQSGAEPISLKELPDSAALRLSKAVRIPTVSHTDFSIDTAHFLAFQNFLKKSFPLLHQELELKVIDSLALLYKWQGRDTSLKPVLHLAHQDVVPSGGNWTVPPFSGELRGDTLSGRGALDIKSALTGMFEAVEMLLKENYRPEKTIYFAFGHDEETGQGTGAAAISEYLEKNRVEPEYILDEGGVILTDAFSALDQPVALVGIAEKGYINLKLIAEYEGGHSSMPGKSSAVNNLAGAVNEISQFEFPAEIEGATEHLFSFVGPEMNYPEKLVFNNTWLFEPLVLHIMRKEPSSAAAVSTTAAVTILDAGEKENVIPSTAVAHVNIRTMPGWTEEKVTSLIKDLVKPFSVKVEVVNMAPSSNISPVTSDQFVRLRQTITSVFPDVVVAPYQLVGITDSRHYRNLTENIYRFHPTRLTKSGLNMIHGADEQIPLKNYQEIINFYYYLMKH